MKTRTPLHCYDLKIKKNYRVLEVGPGHNPSPRSNILVERFIYDNTHRSADVSLFTNQKLINGSGEDLPFKDLEFDYSICKQVIEHSEDPIKFINELTRVSKCGYIEVPSLIGEYLAPKKSHKWAILEIDNKLVFYEKSKILGNYEKDYGEVFLNYLPYQSLPYKLTLITEPKILTIRHEWENNVEVLVNPKDEYFSKYFLSEWNREMAEKIFPRRPFHKELKNTLKGLVGLIRVKMYERYKNRLTRISAEEYFSKELKS